MPKSAKIIWLPVGRSPVAEDFNGPDLTCWKDGKEAIQDAMKAEGLERIEARAPWMMVGETIYSPEQIRTLHDAQVEQRAGGDEAMPGDQPWE